MVVIMFMTDQQVVLRQAQNVSRKSYNRNDQYLGSCHFISQNIFVESLFDPVHNPLCYGNMYVIRPEVGGQAKCSRRKSQRETSHA